MNQLLLFVDYSIQMSSTDLQHYGFVQTTNLHTKETPLLYTWQYSLYWCV